MLLHTLTTPRCGIVETTDAEGMAERMRAALERYAMPCREMRKRRCDRRKVAHGYCRCRLPCDGWMVVDGGAEETEEGLEMAAEQDDDEVTRGMVEQICWQGGSRYLRERVMERRAQRFYGEDAAAPAASTTSTSTSTTGVGQGRPWRLEPLRAANKDVIFEALPVAKESERASALRASAARSREAAAKMREAREARRGCA